MDTGVAIFPTHDAIGPGEVAIWSWPKPAQKPHPPVLVGGGGPVERALDAFERAVAELNGE